MQFLWKYIDDLVGKGLEIGIVIELLFYSSASMVPLALPLAVLLSSIMTFGNLGEQNELVVMKASGISLLRIMRSLIITVVLISIGALLFSNYALPYANLKFGSLLFDIRQQKPALNIKEGVFYNGLEGYSLRVNKKSDDNKTIFDIMVYDHTNGRGNDVVILAEKGEMLATPDKQYLILRLYNGRQFQELQPKSNEKNKENPYEETETRFEVWEKTFDLSVFNLNRTDEELFRNHFQMMSIKQLNNEIDSMQIEIEEKSDKLIENITPRYYFLSHRLDTINTPFDTNVIFNSNNINNINIIRNASRRARSIASYTSIAAKDIELKIGQIARAEVEWHRKFTLSVACIILFFIGGPLGSIIRKGGLGMPLVISVLFFIVLHVFSMIGEKFSKELFLTPLSGMWLASFVLLPIGIILTYRVMYDSPIFHTEWYKNQFRKIKITSK